MGIAGAAQPATVGTLWRGHWCDAVAALLIQAVRADGQRTATADLGRARELTEITRRVLPRRAQQPAGARPMKVRGSTLLDLRGGGSSTREPVR